MRGAGRGAVLSSKLVRLSLRALRRVSNDPAPAPGPTPAAGTTGGTAGPAGRPARSGIYRGYPIALVAFLSSGLSIGMAQYAFGVFIEPLEDEFGWTRTEINLSLSLGLITGLLSPLIGRWMDRIGARPVMAVSLGLIGAGFLLRAVMTDLWQFYLFSALLFAGFPGATVLPAGRLVAVWFARTRGRMMGIVMAGNNFGGLTMAPLAVVLVAVAGWRWAFATFGVVIIVMLLVVLWVISDRPEDVAGESGKRGAPSSASGGAASLPGYSVSQVIRMPTFYFLTAGLTAAMFTYTAVLTQIFPHMEAEGFSRGEATLAMTILGTIGIVSKIVFGRLSETITARWATVFSLALQSVGLALFIVGNGSPVAWVAVVVFASGFGGLGALMPLTIAEAFGVRHFGSVMGLASLVGVVPVVVGP